jgi:integrase/recombinase XerC
MPRKSSKIGDLEIRFNERSRFYDVPVPIAGTNRRRWISTGCRSLAEAAGVVADSGVNRLVHLANAKAVTQAAIQIITAGRKVTCTEILGSFTCESAGRWSDVTLAAHRTNIMAFFRWVGCASKPLVEVERKTVLEWVNHGDAAYNTRCVRMSSMRALYRYARARNFVLENMAEDAFIDRRKMSHDELEPARVEPFTEAEFWKIVNYPDITTFWRYATCISYWSGLRFSDCVCLEWDSITVSGLIVWTRKRGKRIVLPWTDTVLGVKELEVIFACMAREDKTYVFPEERAQYVSGKRSRFPTAYRTLLDKLEIKGKSFHSLRHTAATRLKAAGKTLEDIGQVLGHSSIETTKIYVHSPPS